VFYKEPFELMNIAFLISFQPVFLNPLTAEDELNCQDMMLSLSGCSSTSHRQNNKQMRGF